MSYLGDCTVFEIQLEGGAMMRVRRPNLSRTDQEDFTWGDKVSMHWDSASPVVLLARPRAILPKLIVKCTKFRCAENPRNRCRVK